jgi:hypothetical protein
MLIYSFLHSSLDHPVYVMISINPALVKDP